MVETFVYDDLKSAIDKARAKTAKFHRVDLHVHTIGSHDFPSVHSSKPGFVKKVPADEKGPKEKPDEFRHRYVQRAKDQCLRLVAVTDHNESDMAEQLSAMSDDELTILPGIEISVQTNLFPDSKVHIIGIFPQGTSSKQIDKVFPPDCGIPASGKRREGAHTNQPINEIIETIKSLQGICIAAHASSTSGVRTMVRSQNVEWLQKNYLRRYLKEKRYRICLSIEEIKHLQKLEEGLKPLDDKVQNAYLTFLADHEFDAIQIQKMKHRQFYAGAHVGMLNLPPFPCVLASDAHTLADLGCPGYGTHIKMTEVGRDGLHKAFRDPDTRIRYDTTVPTKRPKCILGVAFEGGSFDGQVIGFSDNLTTLIGGRGTGKSALIEALRLVLCQPIGSLPDRLRGDIEERRDFTLRETEVKLLFADQQGESFVLKRRLGESRTSCFTIDGKPLPEIKLPTSQRIRAEIYGWSEIEELSDSPRKQLAMLDRTVPGIDDLQLEMQARVEELRVNGERVVALAREIQDLLPHTQGAEEVRQQLESLSSPELNEAFASFDRNDAALRALETLGKEIEDAKSWLLDQGQKRKLDQDLSEALQEAKECLQDYSWYAQFSQMIGKNAAKSQRLYDQLLATLDAVKDEIDSRIAELQQERDSIEAQLNVLAEKSGQGDFKAALSKRKELTAKMSKILSFEKDIQEKQTDIDQLLDTRYTQIVPTLTSARSRMYQARLAKANAIANKLAELRAASGINIEIEPMGDVEAFSRLLGHREKSRTAGLFKGIDKHYLSKDYPGFYAQRFSPHDFVKVFLKDITDCGSLAIHFIRRQSDQPGGEIVRLVEGTVEEQSRDLVEYDTNRAILGKWASSEFELVEMEDTQKIWKYLSPLYCDSEINGHYDPQKLKNLLELELSDIEDRPRILLDGKPIEGLSPGQRCSALIPIILVEGQNPLVIDQPEDNLDNKLIFDLVIDILRGLKVQRQIIVATHNPNMPVSGDAEQVVVFESPSREQCCVAEQGSIDDEAIIQHIKTVMEGGDRAFEIRMRKYGLLRST